MQDIDKLFDLVERSLGEFGKNQEFQQIKDSAKQHIKEVMKAIWTPLLFELPVSVFNAYNLIWERGRAPVVLGLVDLVSTLEY